MHIQQYKCALSNRAFFPAVLKGGTQVHRLKRAGAPRTMLATRLKAYLHVEGSGKGTGHSLVAPEDYMGLIPISPASSGFLLAAAITSIEPMRISPVQLAGVPRLAVPADASIPLVL